MVTHFLFDIDGTLIGHCPSHGKAMFQAMREVYGCEPDRSGLIFAGMTDWQIARELLLRANLSLEAIDEKMPRFVERVSEIFDTLVTNGDICELPHARATVQRLQDQGHHLSLVTGNFIRIAYRKMRFLGLHEHFPVGGFGSDHHHRPHLPKLACERALAHYGATPSSAFVVGDTIRDIEAAKANNLGVIAVGTGRHASVQDLLAAGADYAIADLSQFPWKDFK
jgi:phosphoglycolate phosphatase